ncbi:potassium-efflux system domain protein [Burkholderia pseudomallei ABCPW 107]|nr:potassium-efflux system domain protein [Burkholderia pseudomallei ABCPW 107]
MTRKRRKSHDLIYKFLLAEVFVLYHFCRLRSQVCFLWIQVWEILSSPRPVPPHSRREIDVFPLRGIYSRVPSDPGPGSIAHIESPNLFD